MGGNWLAGWGTGFSAVGPLFNGDHCHADFHAENAEGRRRRRDDLGDMLDARRQPRQADRGVPQPGNAPPVAVGRDPERSGGSGGAPFVSRIFPTARARTRAPPRDPPLEP